MALRSIKVWDGQKKLMCHCRKFNKYIIKMQNNIS